MTRGALLALALCGCATPEVGRLHHDDLTPLSESELSALRQQRLEVLLDRAAFDLQTARAGLITTCLGKDPNGLCVTAGVDGGASRATYVWARTDVGQAQWVKDAASAR